MNNNVKTDCLYCGLATCWYVPACAHIHDRARSPPHAPTGRIPTGNRYDMVHHITGWDLALPADAPCPRCSSRASACEIPENDAEIHALKRRKMAEYSAHKAARLSHICS